MRAKLHSGCCDRTSARASTKSASVLATLLRLSLNCEENVKEGTSIEKMCAFVFVFLCAIARDDVTHSALIIACFRPCKA